MMFTHLFLDTTQVANVADTLRHAMYEAMLQPSHVDVILKNITAIVAVLAPFIFTLVIVLVALNNKYKRDKLKAEERMRMIDKGIIPPAVEEKKYPIIVNNNGKPIAMWVKLLIGFGAGLFLGMLLNRLGFNENASYWSMICLCMGAMLLFGDNILNAHKKQDNTKPKNPTPYNIEEKQKPQPISSQKADKQHK